MESEVANFTCGADGYPLPNIVWLHNGTFVATSDTTRRRAALTDPFPSPERGYLHAYISTLLVYNLRQRDAGQYRCKVEPANVASGLPILSASLDLTVLPGGIDNNHIRNYRDGRGEF